jgi:hypothetical protein
MSNPYQDYMYKTIGGLSADDYVPRDYNPGQWQGDRNDGTARILSVTDGDEIILQENVYPNPQTKLLELPDGRFMMLFIGDDMTRDANGTEEDKEAGRNRAELFYTISDNGTSWSEPVSVDDDGTWDESPDAFVVDGKVFITWSDASRIFTAADDEKTTVQAMDINAKWYDLASGTLSDTIQITNSDTEICGDLKPMISYDDVTGRLLIYYTKTDYDDLGAYESTNISETSDLEDDLTAEDQQEIDLYGDLVNGYDVIAYRFADKIDGEFVWNDTYDPSEDFDETEAETWYGQRFLILTVSTRTIETPVGDEGLIEQTVEVLSDGDGVYKDPRVIDSDLITYNGLALYAYTIDIDSNLKTTADRKLYIQIYNYDEQSFSHPVEITSDAGYLLTPKFVRASGITYLYWIQDGDIVYADVSTMVKSGLKEVSVTIEGDEQSIYILDKSDGVKDKYVHTAVTHEPDNAIGEFMISSNSDGVYLLWPQYVIKYKNGLQQGDPGTEDPNNIIKEKQLFAAFTEPSLKVKTWTASAETVGSTLDASDFPTDMPAEIVTELMTSYAEAITAGYTIEDIYDNIQLEYNVSTNGYGWSTPMQITFDEGANYSDISFIVDDSGELKISYVQFEQQLTTTDAGDEVFKEGDVGHVLAIRDVTLTSTPVLSEITFEQPIITETANVDTTDTETTTENAPAEEYLFGAGEEVVATIEVGNTGVQPITGGQYQAYMTSNGNEIFTGDWSDVTDPSGNNVILGGNSVTVKSAITLPEDISDVKVGFRFNNELENISAVKDVTAISDVSLTITELTQLSETEALLKVTAKNNGNLPYNGEVTVTIGDAQVDAETVSIPPNDSVSFEKTITINDAMFGEVVTNEDGSVQDSISVTVNAGDATATESIVRYLSADYVTAFNALEDIVVFEITKAPVAAEEGTSAENETSSIADNFIETEKPLADEFVINIDTYKEITARGVFTDETQTGSVNNVDIETYNSDYFNITYASSDNSILTVTDTGVLVPMKTGTVTLTVKNTLNNDRVVSDIGLFSFEDKFTPNGFELEKTRIINVISSGAEDALTITFKSWDGTILKTQIVEHGGTATAPTAPARTGYTFSGWDKEFNNVTTDLEITAQYTRDYTPGSGSSSGTTTGNASTENGTTYVSVKPKTSNKNGVSTTTVDADDLKKAAEKVLEEAEKKNAAPIIKLEPSTSSSTKELAVTLSSDAAKELADSNIGVIIDTKLVQIKIDPNKLQDMIDAADGKDVVIGAGLVSEVSENQKSRTEDRPVYSINAGSDAGVSIPYKTSNDEDPKHIVVYAIDENGMLSKTDSVYDAETGSINFTTSDEATYFIDYDILTDYDDLNLNGWYYEDVEFAVGNSLFKGTGDTEFSPDTPMTRGMLVTVLSRLYGGDISTSENEFSDVAQGEYYSDAVAWAAKNGIVNGLGDGVFAPDQEVTREQMATILKRYADLQNNSSDKKNDIDSYADGAQVSDWAKDAMAWANGEGIINGTSDTTLDPLADATRAQVAAIFNRFVKTIDN